MLLEVVRLGGGGGGDFNYIVYKFKNNYESIKILPNPKNSPFRIIVGLCQHQVMKQE